MAKEAEAYDTKVMKKDKVKEDKDQEDRVVRGAENPRRVAKRSIKSLSEEFKRLASAGL